MAYSVEHDEYNEYHEKWIIVLLYVHTKNGCKHSRDISH